MSDKSKDETEGNLVTAFVAAKVFPKNVVIAGAKTVVNKLTGNNDRRTFGERLDDLMERDCEPFATKKRKG